MDRTLLASGSLAIFVGAVALTSGCDPAEGTTTSSTSSSTSTGMSSGEGGMATGGNGGTAGSAGSGGTAGSGGSSTSGMAGAGGTGGSAGAGGSAGSGGTAGMGGSGGSGGGSTGPMPCRACNADGTCSEPCVPSKPNDMDCDGWTTAEGDCCDNCLLCGSPASVNPGAFEYLGNGENDDCDLTTRDDQAPPSVPTCRCPLRRAPSSSSKPSTSVSSPSRTCPYPHVNGA